MIELIHVSKRFGEAQVLKDVSLSVAKGEMLALIGRSGEGKSVLLKHIAGLLRPDSGSVVLDGQHLEKLSGRGLRALRSRIGFVFQGGALFDSMTVQENVACPLQEKTHLPEADIRAKVFEGLAQVGLTGAENKHPSELSGGMVKRTALARVLVTNPEIVLFDEPTTGLDPIISNAILDLIQACHQRFHFTGVIISHQMSDVFRIAQRVAMLHGGRIRLHGTPAEFQNTEDAVVRQFITGSRSGPLTWI